MLVILILTATAIGFKKGLIKEVASLLGVLVGGLFAFYFSSGLAYWIERGSGIPLKGSVVLAFVVIFGVVLAAFYMLGRFLSGVARLLFLSWLNHLAGGIFGLLKGGLIILLMVFLVSLKPLPATAQRLVDSSYIATRLHREIASLVLSCPVCPEIWRAQFVELLRPGERGN